MKTVVMITKKNKPLPLNEKCKTHLILDITLPNILLFLLELSDELDEDILQNGNLKLLKKNYKHLFLPEIKIEIINMNYWEPLIILIIIIIMLSFLVILIKKII